MFLTAIVLIVFCVSSIGFCRSTKRAVRYSEGRLEELTNPPDATVDIIAVQGFGSGYPQTWTKDGVMWLKDLLPKNIPQARILAYVYPSKWRDDPDLTDLGTCGESLLQSIKRYRLAHDFDQSTGEIMNRPTIFIGHSFGGLVIKKALVLAKEEESDQILSNTSGILFLGTPHQGTWYAFLGRILTWVWPVLGGKADIRLLQTLALHSDDLFELKRSFRRSSDVQELLRRNKIVCFFETKGSYLGGPVVNKQSAYLDDAELIEMNVTHRDLNKFSKEEDESYQKVLDCLKRFTERSEPAERGESTSNNLFSNASKALSRINRVVERQEDFFSDQEFSSIMNWLSPLDFHKRQRDILEKRTPGTTQWFLDSEEFKLWRNGQCNPFWCSGAPGVGKTVISSVIVEHLRAHQEQAPVLALFCNYKEKEMQTAENLIGSLLKQFNQHVGGVSRHCKDLYDRNRRDHTLPTFQELASTLAAELKDTDLCYVILDAMDENENHAERVLYAILQLKSRVLLLVTSRNLPLDGFGDFWQLNILARSDDIRAFIVDRLSKDRTSKERRLKKFVANTKGLRGDVIEKVATIADGMFLLAELHLKSLVQRCTVRDLRDALQTLPSTLNDTYDEAMLRIKAQCLVDQEIARDVILLVANARVPLTMGELNYAMSIRNGDTDVNSEGFIAEDDLLLPCCGLVLMDQESRQVRLVHYTAQKYFDEKKALVAEAELLLATKCLTYLSFGRFGIGPCRETWNDEQGGPLARRLTENVLLSYASCHWANHAKSAYSYCPSDESRISQLILEFLQQDAKVECSSQVMFSKRKFGNSQYTYGIHHAAYFGLCSALKDFLAKPSTAARLDAYGKTPLIFAAHNGQLQAASLLLESGVNVNRGSSSDIGDALQAASFKGHLDVVKLLVEKGAAVNQEGGERGAALQASSLGGHRDVAKLLLDYGAEVDQDGGEYGSALQASSFAGHLEVVTLLLENGADVNRQGGAFGNALQASSSAGHLKVVRLLLDRGVDVNKRGNLGGNPLQAASSNGHLEVVKLLLESGANVNGFGGSYGYALTATAYSGHLEVAKLLLEKGADVNLRRGSRFTPIQAASRGGPQVVKLLLESGADVHNDDGHFGNALQVASRWGNLETVKLLLINGVDVNKCGGSYGSALQASSCYGHMDIVKLLLEKGADVNQSGGYYGNALQASSFRGELKAVRLLLEKGADVNQDGGHYRSALQGASHFGRLEVVKLLLESGADVNKEGGPHGNALQAASTGGHLKIVNLLLEKGASVNKDGGEYGNALQSASSRGHPAVVKILLDSGADVNKATINHGDPLYAASWHGFLDVVKLLLEKGAGVNHVGGKYGNALQAASTGGHLEVVKLLLETGVNVNKAGGEYGNALQAASTEGHLEIVLLLLEKGADVNKEGGYFGNAYQAAFRGGHKEVATCLLNNGADAGSDYYDSDGSDVDGVADSESE